MGDCEESIWKDWMNDCSQTYPGKRILELARGDSRAATPTGTFPAGLIRYLAGSKLKAKRLQSS
jgi:hypothetical protein